MSVCSLFCLICESGFPFPVPIWSPSSSCNAETWDEDCPLVIMVTKIILSSPRTSAISYIISYLKYELPCNLLYTHIWMIYSSQVGSKNVKYYLWMPAGQPKTLLCNIMLRMEIKKWTNNIFRMDMCDNIHACKMHENTLIIVPRHVTFTSEH